jgi:uncharacterized protein
MFIKYQIITRFMIDLSYWFLFPLGILISSIAMASGIEGGVFWMPVYKLLIGLEPSLAVGMALITKSFGFASGMIFHAKKLIDWKFGTNILLYSIPSAIFGSIIVIHINEYILKFTLSIFLLFIGMTLLFRTKKGTYYILRLGV